MIRLFILLSGVPAISHRLIEALEPERARIAGELHDDICQHLALLTIELELQQSSPDLPPETRGHMGELRKQSFEIATDIQSLSHRLSKLEYLGLAAAMRSFCQEFGELQNVEVDFNTNDLPSFLSQDISLCLFRVLPEALRNSAKHSGVRCFEVRLWAGFGEIHPWLWIPELALTWRRQKRADDLASATWRSG